MKIPIEFSFVICDRRIFYFKLMPSYGAILIFGKIIKFKSSKLYEFLFKKDNDLFRIRIVHLRMASKPIYKFIKIDIKNNFPINITFDPRDIDIKIPTS